MGLIKCIDCGHDVSDRAAACPNCGGPMEQGTVPQANEREPDAISKIGPVFSDGAFGGARKQVIDLAAQAIQALNYRVDKIDESGGIVSFTTGMTMGSWSGVSGSLLIRETKPGWFQVSGTAKQNVRGGQLVALNLFDEANGKVENVIAEMRRLVSSGSANAAASTELTQSELENWRKTESHDHKFLGFFAAAIIFLLIVGMLNVRSEKTKSDDSVPMPSEEALVADAMADASADAKQSPATLRDNWSYSTDEDKVRNRNSYFATTTSTNSIFQSSPYDAETTMTMTLRSSPAYGTDVILTISSGQMMCPSYEGCSGRVKFDDGAPQRVSFNGPEDNSSETVFVVGAKSFIAKLKRAKKVVIEKTLYQAGNPQFEFDVAGLKWDH